MTTPDQQPEPQQPQAEAPSTSPKLAEALRELGEQIEQTARAVLSSERSHEIQQNVSKGLNEMGANLQKALESLRANPQVQGITERAQKSLTEAQQSGIFKDLQDTLAKALAQASTQLAEFSERIKADQATANPDVPAQQVPIEHEDDTPPPPPAADDSGASTGPTVRLDP